MKIMAIDPGGTTGLASVEVEGNDRRVAFATDDVKRMKETLRVEQLGTPQEDFAALRVFERIVNGAPDVVVMEDFRLFPDRAHGPNTEETIADRYLARLDLLLYLWSEYGIVCAPVGMVASRSSWGSRHGAPMVVKSMPGERIAIKDEWLKENGLWRTPKAHGGGEHSMQALKHLVVTLRKIRSGKLVVSDGRKS